ncbi:MAG: hypothetical protein ACI8PT_003379 [Gammaproteobacteria bacterium]|jgi:hypothetical protein
MVGVVLAMQAGTSPLSKLGANLALAMKPIRSTAWNGSRSLRAAHPVDEDFVWPARTAYWQRHLLARPGIRTHDLNQRNELGAMPLMPVIAARISQSLPTCHENRCAEHESSRRRKQRPHARQVFFREIGDGNNGVIKADVRQYLQPVFRLRRATAKI